MITGDEGRLGGSDVCLCLQGETKLYAKLKAFLKQVLQKIHRLLYVILILCTCTWDIVEDAHHGAFNESNYLCKNFGVEEGRGHLGSLAGDYSTYNYSMGGYGADITGICRLSAAGVETLHDFKWICISIFIPQSAGKSNLPPHTHQQKKCDNSLVSG